MSSQFSALSHLFDNLASFHYYICLISDELSHQSVLSHPWPLLGTQLFTHSSKEIAVFYHFSLLRWVYYNRPENESPDRTQLSST